MEKRNRRKRQWEEDQNLDEEPEHRLFENFELHKFLSCTVEVGDDGASLENTELIGDRFCTP